MLFCQMCRLASVIATPSVAMSVYDAPGVCVCLQVRERLRVALQKNSQLEEELANNNQEVSLSVECT